MRPLVLDVSRLLTGLRFAGPTGVETLELGLARHLPPGPGLAMTPWGARAVSAATRTAIANAAAKRWREDVIDVAQELAPVAAFLRGETVTARLSMSDRSLLAAARFLPRLLRSASHLPQDAVTVHTGFFRLEQPGLFNFKTRRADLRTIIAFHDILPLKRPDWFRSGETALHRARLLTALDVADVIAVGAECVRADIVAFATEVAVTPPRIEIVDLPVSSRLASATPLAFAAPYMVVCGTIEPRKNHALLLEVWRRLGAGAPKLVIAGRRGWQNDALFASLDARPANVLELPGLSSPALAALIKGASALLSPSLDEGYGLPVAEALASGTPVIAADTQIYRELWGGKAVLVDPADPAAWADAVKAPPPRATPFLRTGWPAYVSALTALAAAL